MKNVKFSRKNRQIFLKKMVTFSYPTQSKNPNIASEYEWVSIDTYRYFISILPITTAQAARSFIQGFYIWLWQGSRFIWSKDPTKRRLGYVDLNTQIASSSDPHIFRFRLIQTAKEKPGKAYIYGYRYIILNAKNVTWKSSLCFCSLLLEFTFGIPFFWQN